MVYVRGADGVFLEKRSPRKTCHSCGQIIVNRAHKPGNRRLNDEEMMDAIHALVAKHFHTTPETMLAKTSNHRMSLARDFCLYLSVEETACTPAAVATKFKTDRSRVSSAYQRIEKLLQSDRKFRQLVQPVLDWIPTA